MRQCVKRNVSVTLVPCNKRIAEKMTDQNYRKSFYGTKGTIMKGKVNELRQRYELRSTRQNELPRSISESSLVMDKYDQMNSEINKSTEHITGSDLMVSTQQNKRNLFSKELRENNNKNTIQDEFQINSHNLTYRPTTNGNISPKLRQINQLCVELGLTSEIHQNTIRPPKVTSMSKKPIPSPRVKNLNQDSLQRRKHSEDVNKPLQSGFTEDDKYENLKKLNKGLSKSSQDLNTVLSSTFPEADKTGNRESFRKSLLSIMDEKINEMKLDGFDDNKSFNNGDDSSEESDNEIDKIEFNSDQEPLLGEEEEEEEEGDEGEKVANDSIYVNLNELLISKPNELSDNLRSCQDNKEITRGRTEHNIYETIDEQILKNFTSQANFYKLNPTGDNNTGTTIGIKERLNWNIPPDPNRSSKPPTSCNKGRKNFAYSTFYDESDDENYEDFEQKNNSNIVDIKQKEETRPKFWRNDQLKCENSPATQSNKLLIIIQEFKKTEVRYLQELNEIVPVYKYGIKNHSSSKIKSKMQLICAAIDKLLELQTEFADMINSSDDSIETTLRTFIDFEKLFVTYQQCLGTNDSITIIIGYDEDNCQKKINLPSMLNQRLTHYKDFLDRIRKEVSLQNDPKIFQLVLCSLNTILEIINSCNTMLLLSRVQNIPLKADEDDGMEDEGKVGSSFFVQCCPFDVSSYGDFLLMDRFKISKPFSMTLTVFLFNNIIVFTTEQQKDEYFYYSHIKMSDVRLMPLDKKNKDVLGLQHFGKSRQFHSPTNYKLKAKNAAIVEKWRNKINDDCLWTQKLTLREEVTKRYSVKRTVSRPVKCREF